MDDIKGKMFLKDSISNRNSNLGVFFECKRENFPKLFLTTENIITHLF